MGKSQTRRLREATKRFGRENWGRWYNTRAMLSFLALKRKEDAGLVAPTVSKLLSTGPTIVKRYSTTLTYQENEDKFGRVRKAL